MGSHQLSALRSPNATVSISIREYTSKLGSLFGVKAEYGGPGPIVTERSGRNSAAGDFAVKYLFEELFSKFDDGKANTQKWETCLSRFHEAEELCRDTNWRFQRKNFLFSGNLSPGFSATKAMWLAQRKIESLLSAYEDAVLLDGCGFGPGATTRLPRTRCDLGYKFGGTPHVTPAATSLVRKILPDVPLWERSLMTEGATYQVVRGNKVVSVPKSYKTDRMIAIEPDWNMYLQKALGKFFRKVLRRVGIDLNDQSNNAFCAGLGSLYGDLATIDLSMASDTVAYELVRFLLPPDWFEVLEQLRSPVGVLASGEVVEYQKFSSMGNGYTFELESLIFWALCSSVIELMKLKDRRLLVYGDDLVVPTEAYAGVVDVLTLAGFVPNQKKSFGSGPFRESCGSHFYEGNDVTPIYIREPVTRLDRLFLLHNNSARLLQRLEPFVVATAEEVSAFLEWIRSHAPESWQKPRLPRLDVGDGAFYGSFGVSTPKRARRGWEGWMVKTLQSRPAMIRTVEETHNPLLKGLWVLENSYSKLQLGKLSPRLAAVAAKAREPDSTPRYPDMVVNYDYYVEWRVSKQFVRSLATDCAWWELFY